MQGLEKKSAMHNKGLEADSRKRCALSSAPQPCRWLETISMDGTRFIVAGNFIDGSGAAARRNIFLAVKDGAITAIGSAADLPRHDGAAIDDFSHCTILPALVDCSVSLSRSPSVGEKGRLSPVEAGIAKQTALVKQHSRYCHIHGVLGVADGDELSGLGEFYPEGKPQGLLELRSAGHLYRSGQDGAAGHPAEGDFLKIGYSANIEDEATSSPLLNLADLGRLLHHRGGKKAVVVANGRHPVAAALAAGCDAIEQGYAMGEDNLRNMAARGVLWIPSLLRAKNGLDGSRGGGDVCCRFSQRYVAPGKPVPGAEAWWQKVLAEQLAQLRLARNLGVTAAVGTGAGSAGILHGESVVEEVKLFIKAGYSLAETIRCASENGARFFGMEKLGMLTVGRPATFLLTRGSVQQLPRKLSYLEGIYIAGAPSGSYRKNPVKHA
jgi:imidazolonepropionase-like amidohydrolase